MQQNATFENYHLHLIIIAKKTIVVMLQKKILSN